MTVIDLTYDILEGNQESLNIPSVMHSREVPLEFKDQQCTGIIHQWEVGSMAGTYIDFPGHIKESNDGVHAGNVNMAELYKQPATVIQLDRCSKPGAVEASMLRQHCKGDISTPVLIVNGLGSRCFSQVKRGDVYFSVDAIDWIISCGVKIIVSNIYEGRRPQGLFLKLFEAGLWTVCCPVSLDKIKKPIGHISIFPLKVSGAYQVPCRVIVDV